MKSSSADVVAPPKQETHWPGVLPEYIKKGKCSHTVLSKIEHVMQIDCH